MLRRIATSQTPEIMRFLLITALLPLTASFASTPPEPEPEPKGLPKGLQPGGDVELTLSYKPSSGLTTRYKLSSSTHTTADPKP